MDEEVARWLNDTYFAPSVTHLSQLLSSHTHHGLTIGGWRNNDTEAEEESAALEAHLYRSW